MLLTQAMRNDMAFADVGPDLDGEIPSGAALVDDKVIFSSLSQSSHSSPNLEEGVVPANGWLLQYSCLSF